MPGEAFTVSHAAEAPPADRPGDLDVRARRLVGRWLLGVIAGLFVLATVGGWVRLTRSGLSIVEWQVVTGVVPPRNARQWEEAFAAYRATPEYRHVHRDIDLREFRRIYLREWLHRLLGRAIGLAFVIPLAVFLARGTIPRRRTGPYVLIAGAFALQGALGWYMVRSGLIDRPSVSHYRLAAHLLAACLILFLCVRQWLHVARPVVGPADGPARRWSASLLVLLVVQMFWGALTAGLKAGFVCDTFPLWYGRWIPAGLRTGGHPLWSDLTANPIAVQYVHRWMAAAVVAAAFGLALRGRTAWARRAGSALAAALLAQGCLGAAVVVLHVPLWAALAHQVWGLVVFTGASAVFCTARMGGSRGS